MNKTAQLYLSNGLVKAAFWQRPQKPDHRRLEAVGGLYATDLAGMYAAPAIGRVATKNFDRSDDVGLRALLDEYERRGHDLPDLEVMQRTGGPSMYAFIPAGRSLGRTILGADGPEHLRLGNKPAVLQAGYDGHTSLQAVAHELGHAEWHGRQFPAMGNLRTGAGIGGGIGGVIESIRGLRKGISQRDRDQNFNRASGLIAAGLAPTLADEAIASTKGYNMLRRLPGAEAIARSAPRAYIPAFGSYAALAAASIASPQVAKHIMDRKQS